jgi:hypothetical protein
MKSGKKTYNLNIDTDTTKSPCKKTTLYNELSDGRMRFPKLSKKKQFATLICILLVALLVFLLWPTGPGQDDCWGAGLTYAAGEMLLIPIICALQDGPPITGSLDRFFFWITGWIFLVILAVLGMRLVLWSLDAIQKGLKNKT